MQSGDDIRDNSFRILEATVSPLEVSPGTPRRRWSAAARERIVREAMAPGANVSAVARANGLKPQQLFGWRRRALAEAGLLRGAREGVTQTGPALTAERLTAPFVEVSVVENDGTGSIDVIGGGVTVRGGPGVSMARLQMVLRAVRSS